MVELSPAMRSHLTVFFEAALRPSPSLLTFRSTSLSLDHNDTYRACLQGTTAAILRSIIVTTELSEATAVFF